MQKNKGLTACNCPCHICTVATVFAAATAANDPAAPRGGAAADAPAAAPADDMAVDGAAPAAARATAHADGMTALEVRCFAPLFAPLLKITITI